MIKGFIDAVKSALDKIEAPCDPNEGRIEKLSVATGVSKALISEIGEASGCEFWRVELALMQASRKGLDSDDGFLALRCEAGKLDKAEAAQIAYSRVGRSAWPVAVWAMR